MTTDEAKKVWEIMYRQWPEDAVMRLFFRNAAGSTRGGYVVSPEDLARETDYATASGWNSYIQMNPTARKSGYRVSGNDVTHWSWFLIDIDPTGPPGPNLHLVEVADFIEAFIWNRLGSKDEATRIMSGRGLQMWFPLQITDASEKLALRYESLPRDFEIEDREKGTVSLTVREAAPRAMSWWLDRLRRAVELALPKCECTIDTSVSDLPRVMRLPFTWNFKSNQPTTLVREAVVPNRNLAHKLLHYAPYSVWRPQETYEGYEVGDGVPWQKFLNHPGMKVRPRVFLTEGMEYGGRHKAATSALLTLKELGCNAEQTEAALLWGGALCSPPLERKEIAPMIERHFKKGELCQK